MKLKEGKKERWAQIESEHQVTPQSRRELRFAVQWVTCMEQERESGVPIHMCAKKTLANESHRYVSAGCNLEEWINLLKEVWLYGDELADWYTRGGVQQNVYYSDVLEERNGNEFGIYVTDHASRRLHERLGLGKKAGRKTAKKALQQGFTIEQTEGLIRSYMAKFFYNTGDSAEIRLFHKAIFVFKQKDNGMVLITVLPVPKNCQKYQERECRRTAV